jgi:protein TonB
MKKLQQHLVALASMCGGSVLVFGTVLYMNQQQMPEKEPARESATELHVEKKPPPKKKKERERRQRPEPKRASAPAPRAPDLSSNISGVTLEFSGISEFGLGGVTKDLIGGFDKKGPMTEGALDNPPKPASRGGSQEYPPKARKEGIEGYVLLNIYVRDDGSVGGVKVLDASPKGVFEDSAKTYVEDWSFVAGTYEGQAVDSWVKQKVVYKLQRS